MDSILGQVIAGVIVAAISVLAGWNAKAFQMRQKAGRDASGAQAERGAAAAHDRGVAVGNVQADGGGVINQHIGDRNVYGQQETEEERQRRRQLERNRRIYSFAIQILRNAAGAYVSPTRGHMSLPGYLWYEHERNWFPVVTRIANHDGHNGQFVPHVEPNAFNGEDPATVRTATIILRWYLWSSANCPDFQDIQTRFDLPTVADIAATIE